jgi:hypothetical protein
MIVDGLDASSAELFRLRRGCSNAPPCSWPRCGNRCCRCARCFYKWRMKRSPCAVRWYLRNCKNSSREARGATGLQRLALADLHVPVSGLSGNAMTYRRTLHQALRFVLSRSVVVTARGIGSASLRPGGKAGAGQGYARRVRNGLARRATPWRLRPSRALCCPPPAHRAHFVQCAQCCLPRPR